MKKILIFLLLLPVFFGGGPAPSFDQFISAFVKDYHELHIPGFTFDFREYFTSIPSAEDLQRQRKLFERNAKGIMAFDELSLEPGKRKLFLQLRYEIEFNLQRISLEEKWVKAGRKIPESSLHDLDDRSEE